MTNRAPIVSNFPLDRSYYYPLDGDGAAIAKSKALTAAQAFTIKIDLNGTSNIKFYIGEEGNANNIGGFNLTVNFYEETGQIITSSTQTVAVPATTKNTNQYVDITGGAYIETANYAIISGTIPYTAAITVTFFAKGIYETAIDDLSTVLDTISATMADVESAIGTLVGTTADVSSAISTLNATTADVKSAIETLNATTADVSSAVATLNTTMSAVIYTDGDAFTYSASKTLAIGGTVDPIRTGAAGEVLSIAVDDTGQVRTADFDSVAKIARMAETNPKNAKFDPSTSLMNAITAAATAYIDMDYYDSLALQLIMSSGTSATLAVSGTLQDDGTADDSCTYTDVTSEAYGGAQEITAIGTLMFTDEDGYFGQFKYVKIVVTPTAATCTLHARRKVL